MPSTETQTEMAHQHRDEELHKKLNFLAERFNVVEKNQEDFKTSLKFTQEEVKDLKEENESLKESLLEMSLEIQRNTYAIQKLTGKQANLETNTKKKNLILEGVPELQQRDSRENLQDTICAIFAEMGISKPIDYDLAYRIGNYEGKLQDQFSSH